MKPLVLVAATALPLALSFALSACSDQDTPTKAVNKTSPPTRDAQSQLPTTKKPAMDASVPAKVAAVPTPMAKRELNPSELPTWSKASTLASTLTSKKGIVVHAADVSSRLLSFALTNPKKQTVLQLVPESNPYGPLISARFAAKNASSAWEVLATNESSVKAMAIKRPRGRGQRVDLRFHKAELADVLRLYSSVMAENILLRSAKSSLDMSFAGLPVDAAFNATVEAAGLKSKKVGDVTWVGLTPGAEADKKLVKIRKPIVSLSTHQAFAYEVVEALRAIGATGHATGCDNKEPIDLALRKASFGSALSALEVVAKADVNSADPQNTEACVTDVPRIPTIDDSFVATVTAGSKRAAVFRGRDQKSYIVVDGSKIDGAKAMLGWGQARFGERNLEVERFLHPAEATDSVLPVRLAVTTLIREGRVAATMVSSKKSSLIVETTEGFVLIEEVVGRPIRIIGSPTEVEFEREYEKFLEIKPGVVHFTIETPNGPKRVETFKLAGRI